MTELAAQYKARQILYVDVAVLSYIAYVLLSTDCLVSVLKMITWILMPFLLKVCILIGAHHLKDNDVSEEYYAFVLRSTVLTFCCSLITFISCLMLCIFWLLTPDSLLLRQLCIALVLFTYSVASVIVLRRWRQIEVTTC
jgi:hypothetical protein